MFVVVLKNVVIVVGALFNIVLFIICLTNHFLSFVLNKFGMYTED